MWLEGWELWPPLWCLSPVSASGVHLCLCPYLWGLSLHEAIAWQEEVNIFFDAWCLGQYWYFFLFIAKRCDDTTIWHLCRAFCLSLLNILKQWYWWMSHNPEYKDHESESCDFFLPAGTKCLWVTAACELKNTDRAMIAVGIVQAAAVGGVFTLQQLLQTRRTNLDFTMMKFSFSSLLACSDLSECTATVWSSGTVKK